MRESKKGGGGMGSGEKESEGRRTRGVRSSIGHEVEGVKNKHRERKEG